VEFPQLQTGRVGPIQRDPKGVSARKDMEKNIISRQFAVFGEIQFLQGSFVLVANQKGATFQAKPNPWKSWRKVSPFNRDRLREPFGWFFWFDVYEPFGCFPK